MTISEQSSFTPLLILGYAWAGAQAAKQANPDLGPQAERAAIITGCMLGMTASIAQYSNLTANTLSFTAAFVIGAPKTACSLIARGINQVQTLVNQIPNTESVPSPAAPLSVPISSPAAPNLAVTLSRETYVRETVRVESVRPQRQPYTHVKFFFSRETRKIHRITMEFNLDHIPADREQLKAALDKLLDRFIDYSTQCSSIKSDIIKDCKILFTAEGYTVSHGAVAVQDRSSKAQAFSNIARVSDPRALIATLNDPQTFKYL